MDSSGYVDIRRYYTSPGELISVKLGTASYSTRA